MKKFILLSLVVVLILSNSFFSTITLAQSSNSNNLNEEESPEQVTDEINVDGSGAAEKKDNDSIEGHEEEEIIVSDEDQEKEEVNESQDINPDENSESVEAEKNSNVDKSPRDNLEENSISKDNHPSVKTNNSDGSNELEEENQNVNVFSLSQANEVSTSKLGHLRSNAKIYKDLGDQSSQLNTSQYLNAVYYIKKQATLNGATYYLISTQPSSTNGVIGWVSASQLSLHDHKTVDKKAKTLYFKGTGKAYNKAWGGSKDLAIGNMSQHEGKVFRVDLTETVGSNTWYRGNFNGARIWLHSSYVTATPPYKESSTSKLGHLRSNAKIYKDLGDQSSQLNTSQYLNAVYYIKKQATLNGATYYLISTQPSSTNGVIGWVSASQLSLHDHKTVDKKAKTLYFKGTGKAYNKAWGGSKDLLIGNMSQHEGNVFRVDLTETVGSNTWYRGNFNGERIWLHSSYVTATPPYKESSTSKLGHLRSNAKIYKDLGDQSSQLNTAQYLNAVYYIKKQAELNGSIYYLISTQPSSTNGVVGWVHSDGLSTHDHKGVDRISKTLFVNGTGKAFSKAWGGSKDLIFELSNYKDHEFQINKTETVGSNTWYRGTLDGEQVFIHEAYVSENNIIRTTYDITIERALEIQMNQLQQTDKYRNSPAYIHANYVNITESGVITGDGVRLRTAANFNNNIKHTVNSGTRVEILGEVTGATYQGSTKWYRIKYNNSTLYVHSSLANPNGLTGVTNADVNVRASESTSSHKYGVISGGTQVNIVNRRGNWVQIQYNTWRNPTEQDVLDYLNPDNHDIFQHLILSESVRVSASSLNNVLQGMGILAGRGQAFIDAGNQHRVNEVYLISHALLETGNGTSDLARGIEVGRNSSGNLVLVTSSNRNSLTAIKKVYNMFGIGANDGDARRLGAIRAYNEGWTSPDRAIVGGARFIGERYIHNQYNQDTLYKMRWNPANPGYPQYATDIAWATKQVTNIKNMYSMLDNPVLRFNIIQYQ
ncbi:SH3 domain-containing protein [Oceanobacillus kimchii]|uniref:N-acetylglucosaminidase n=1 Tax=Oceanobacillus kimchii TaxID=746691 RepID=UPI003C737996